MSDVALSMRRMSLTSVQLLSERVAPQPLTPHQGGETEREEEKGETERKKEERGRKGRQKREEEGCSQISGGNEECGRGRGLMEGGRERFVKDNEAGEGRYC